MRTLLSRAIRVDPSFHIGLGLIVILAVIEIFFATSYYVGRGRAARVSAQAIAATIARPAAPAVSLQTPAPAPAPVQPAVSPAAAVSAPPPSLVDQLLREGIELRDRGDTTNALARLQEALDSEPNNTVVLEEMAKTYESMQLLDRANDIWRKLQEMGPSAGAAYELATQRLKMGVPAPEPADAGTVNSSADATENKETEHKDIGGNLEGPVMGITQVKTTDTSDPDAEKDMALQIGIKKQPGATIDHDKVRIFVKFYDTVGDKDIKLTDADVNYEWLTPKHDWTETNPEVLSVKYVRPKTSGASSESSLSETAATVRPGQKGRGAKGSTTDSGRRKYLGYIIQVYYDDELQAVQAEPSRLLQLFPPSKGPSAR
jgi:tetratricopeptide (TPR) repeat protein